MDLLEDSFIIDANELPLEAFRKCSDNGFPDFDVQVHFSGGLDDHDLDNLTIDCAVIAGTQIEIDLFNVDKAALLEMLKSHKKAEYQHGIEATNIGTSCH